MKNHITLCNGIYWDYDKDCLVSLSNEIKLTQSEHKTLKLLIDNLDKPISMNEIYEYIFWDDDREFNPKTIRNIISKIRAKLYPEIIENIYGCAYIVRSNCVSKNTLIDKHLPDISGYLIDIIDQAQNGISITNPRLQDNPLVYCNMYFKKTFGYSDDEIIGKNLRFLRKGDTQEEVVSKIRNSIKEQIPLTVQIRNYTKEGKLIPTELTISPIFDRYSGELIYFLGIQKVIGVL
ncbi:MAG: PAS domain-containing protein [Arcobacteraceae bacterium]